MNRGRHHHIALCALSLGLVVAADASAASRDAVLGSSGELYRIRAGTLGDLFPERRGKDSKTPVLALDIDRPGTPVSRILVDGTDDDGTESSPSLAYEDASQTLYVVWESRLAAQSVLRLAGFDGTSWSEPIERITEDFYSRKTAPQLAVTHDLFETVDRTGQRIDIDRRILHIVWGEGDGELQRTYYTPVIFDNGVYIGKNPLYDLTALDIDSGLSTSIEVSPDLLKLPVLQKGRDGRTVVVAFTAPVTRRLLSLEIDILPRQLSHLADGTRAVIIDTGAKLRGNLRGLADKARQAVIDQGRDSFQIELVEAIADRVRDLILGGAGRSLQSLADGTRAVIIDTGAKLAGRGLRNPYSVQAAAAAARLVEISPDLPAPLPAHVIQFRVISSRPVPQIGGSALSLFLSETGDDVLVAWVNGDRTRVVYRDTKGGGWNNPLELVLTDTLTLGQAHLVLEQRIRER
jgi:hypothetical protein